MTTAINEHAAQSPPLFVYVPKGKTARKARTARERTPQPRSTDHEGGFAYHELFAPRGAAMSYGLRSHNTGRYIAHDITSGKFRLGWSATPSYPFVSPAAARFYAKATNMNAWSSSVEVVNPHGCLN